MKTLRCALCLLLFGPAWAFAAEVAAVEVPVVDAYVDLRTGPDEDFPVVYVAERGDLLTVVLRRPGWYKVRTQKGRLGWLANADFERLLARAGMTLEPLEPEFFELTSPRAPNALLDVPPQRVAGERSIAA